MCTFSPFIGIEFLFIINYNELSFNISLGFGGNENGKD